MTASKLIEALTKLVEKHGPNIEVSAFNDFGVLLPVSDVQPLEKQPATLVIRAKE